MSSARSLRPSPQPTKLAVPRGRRIRAGGPGEVSGTFIKPLPRVLSAMRCARPFRMKCEGTRTSFLRQNWGTFLWQTREALASDGRSIQGHFPASCLTLLLQLAFPTSRPAAGFCLIRVRKNQTYHLPTNKDTKECGLDGQSSGLPSPAPRRRQTYPRDTGSAGGLGQPPRGYNLGSRTDYRLLVGTTAPNEKEEENGLGAELAPFLLQTSKYVTLPPGRCE